MIIEIPNDNSIVKWKKNDKEDWKSAEISDLIKAYDKRPIGEWISVSERFPYFSGLYLVSVDDLVTVANFGGAYFINRKGLMLNVSAWQYLPEPYKKGNKE